jgi:hypothetical protein
MDRFFSCCRSAFRFADHSHSLFGVEGSFADVQIGCQTGNMGSDEYILFDFMTTASFCIAVVHTLGIERSPNSPHPQTSPFQRPRPHGPLAQGFTRANTSAETASESPRETLGCSSAASRRLRLRRHEVNLSCTVPHSMADHPTINGFISILLCNPAGLVPESG